LVGEIRAEAFADVAPDADDHGVRAAPVGVRDGTRNPREGRRRAGLATLALEAEQDCRLQMYR
jgi:hypothetical protein